MIPATRAEAKAAGSTRYFNSNPCPRGHVVERMTSNGRCCQCIHDDKMTSRAKNPEKHQAYMVQWHKENTQKEAKYRAKNKEAISENSRQWREENPERHAENARQWRLKNLARADENRRKWRTENPERERFLARRWRQVNPDKQRTIMFNRNCATRGVRQAIAHGLIEKKMEYQSQRCAYCFTDISEQFDIDHITPISKGGDNSDGNLQLLCPRCNRSKRDRTHDEFVRWVKDRGIELCA